jgi:hypothetical protein
MYPGETIHMESHQIRLSGLVDDTTRNPVVACVDPTNNLPTTSVYHHTDLSKAIKALSTTAGFKIRVILVALVQKNDTLYKKFSSLKYVVTNVNKNR